MTFAFISYSRDDRGYVDRLSAYLAGAGIDCWFDFDIASGDRFATVIEDRIRACGAMIVVCSPQSQQSEWIRREVHFASDRQKPLMPLMLKPSELSILLSGVHYDSVVGGAMPPPSFVERLRSLLAVTGEPVAAPRQALVTGVAAPTLADQPPPISGSAVLPPWAADSPTPPRRVAEVAATRRRRRVPVPLVVALVGAFFGVIGTLFAIVDPESFHGPHHNGVTQVVGYPSCVLGAALALAAMVAGSVTLRRPGSSSRSGLALAVGAATALALAGTVLPIL